jgi:anthranilate phosphoribosyltransferase
MFEPESINLHRPDPALLAGSTPEENARISVSILRGEAGPRREIVQLNASGGLVAAGLAEDLRDGFAEAAKSIDSGQAYERLEGLRALTRAEEQR